MLILKSQTIRTAEKRIKERNNIKQLKHYMVQTWQYISVGLVQERDRTRSSHKP